MVKRSEFSLSTQEWPKIWNWNKLIKNKSYRQSKNEPAVTYSLINTSCHKINQKMEHIFNNRPCNNAIKPRVTAYVIRFINKLKNWTQENQKGEKEDLHATTVEFTNTEQLWIKLRQASSFTDELQFLTQKDPRSTPPICVVLLGQFTCPLNKRHCLN